MALPIEPATMFVALVASTIAAMLVLLWGYLLNRGERSLLWTALGFLLTAVGSFLVARRGFLSEWLTIDTAGTLLILGVSFIWIGARVFNGRPILAWVPLAGPAVWLIACNVPAFYANPDARVIAVFLIMAAYYFAGAREFSMRDGLLTRLPMSIVLTAHTAIVLLRIPFVLTDDEGGLNFVGTNWFGAAALESLIFIQLVAFLMLSLTKERVENHLRDAAHTDPLTGLGNRRAFFDRAEAAVALASRNGSPLSVVAFDLDRFKAINDRHGHPIGDAVIETFARVATDRLRVSDIVARLGGEEFVALLPDTAGDRAALVALQINQAFETAVAALPHPDLAGTASAGVAELSPATPSLDDILTAADRALYEAKAIGRGQVRRAAPVAETVRAA
jgi:diguanylate cyclase (GGDEF)-like protein